MSTLLSVIDDNTAQPNTEHKGEDQTADLLLSSDGSGSLSGSFSFDEKGNVQSASGPISGS